MTKFIVIEGLDGSGKTTIVKLLKERYAAINHPCYTTFEPTNNHVGRLMRSIISGKIDNIENETISLLFAADRYQHLHSEILPALEHSHVICDRYFYSSIVYQGLDAAAVERVIAYNQAAIDIRRPDVIFFLDITPEESLRRVVTRGGAADIFEALPALELHYTRYLTTIERMKDVDNVKVVGSNVATPEDIVQQMWECLF